MSALKSFIQIAAWLLLLSSCKKEDGITPQTGNLQITFSNAAITTVRYDEYFLYPEAAYLSAVSNASNLWLKRGVTGINRIDIKGLTPGNYITVVEMESGATRSGAVQVTARQTNEFIL